MQIVRFPFGRTIVNERSTAHKIFTKGGLPYLVSTEFRRRHWTLSIYLKILLKPPPDLHETTQATLSTKSIMAVGKQPFSCELCAGLLCVFLEAFSSSAIALLS